MLLVRTDGTAVGTLGGGCVEGDIWFAAQEILRNQGGPEFKDYYLNEDIAARDGLVCGGTMYFYLEPFWRLTTFTDIGQELLRAYDGAEPAALATVVRSDGDTAQLGAKLLLRSDGTMAGSIGTAELDEMALEVAARVASVGANEAVDIDDKTELFVEGFTTPPTLVMVGGGHVGKATADLAHRLGYRVTSWTTGKISPTPSGSPTQRKPSLRPIPTGRRISTSMSTALSSSRRGGTGSTMWRWNLR